MVCGLVLFISEPAVNFSKTYHIIVLINTFTFSEEFPCLLLTNFERKNTSTCQCRVRGERCSVLMFLILTFLRRSIPVSLMILSRCAGCRETEPQFLARIRPSLRGRINANHISRNTGHGHAVPCNSYWMWHELHWQRARWHREQQRLARRMDEFGLHISLSSNLQWFT